MLPPLDLRRFYCLRSFGVPFSSARRPPWCAEEAPARTLMRPPGKFLLSPLFCIRLFALSDSRRCLVLGPASRPLLFVNQIPRAYFSRFFTKRRIIQRSICLLTSFDGDGSRFCADVFNAFLATDTVHGQGWIEPFFLSMFVGNPFLRKALLKLPLILLGGG